MTHEAKTILVTGASSGIGAQIAQDALAAGYHVVGFARDFSKTAIQHDTFTPVCCDLSDLKSWQKILQEHKNKYTNIAALIVCAGFGIFRCLEEFSYEQIQTLMDVNFTSHAYFVKTFVPTMKSAKQGKIIIIGSESARIGAQRGTIYCASKFALRGFSQALREECAKSNIAVSLINPGTVISPFFDTLDFAPGPDAENAILPKDISGFVMSILHQPSHTVIDEINLSPLKKVLRINRTNKNICPKN